LIPRGLLIPLDPYLNGTARAAKKVGDQMPVLVPNNTATLLNDLHTKDVTFTLNPNTLFYLKEEFLISLNGEKVVRVVGRVGDEITISENPDIELPADSPIYVHAFPITILGDHSIPNPPLPRPDIIELKSNQLMMSGDYLSIPCNGVLKEYEITEIIASRKSSRSVDALAPFIYEVKISQIGIPDDLPLEVREHIPTISGIPRDLHDGETIYLRAFPAYFSKPLIVDSSYFHVPLASIGPYLLDRVSGLVLDNSETAPPSEENPAGDNQGDIDEVMEVDLLSSGLDLFDRVRLQVREQLPVWNPTIESEHMVMWSPQRGTLDFERGFLILNLDKYGFAEIETPLVPEIDLSLHEIPTWRMMSQSESVYNICLEFYPGVYKTETATHPPKSALYSNVLTLSSKPETDPIRAIKISVSGVPGQKVEIHSLVSTNLPIITNVRYRILARTTGSYRWASSGILQKPIWMSAYLTEAYGQRVKLDNGRLMFPTVQPCQPSPGVPCDEVDNF
jgi:hypothetical protein